MDPLTTCTAALTPREVHYYQETLKYHLASERQDLVTCWKLLDALLVRQRQTQMRDAPRITTPLIPREVVQSIVQLWQRKFKQWISSIMISEEESSFSSWPPDPQQDGLWLPLQVTQTLQELAQAKVIPSLLYPTITITTTPTTTTPTTTTSKQQQQHIPAMILDVASHCSSYDLHAGVYFAHAFLQNWIDQVTTTTATTTNNNNNNNNQTPTPTQVVPPDEVVVGTVLQAWVNSGLPDAPQRAEAFMESVLQQLSNDQYHQLLRPNVIWYNCILSAWAKQGNVPKAMEWLERMQQDGNCQPDLPAWNSLLSAWAHHNQETGPDEEHEEASNGSLSSRRPRPRSRPSQRGHRRDSSSSSWNRAPEMVETLLQQMETLYQKGQLTQPPNVISYSILLDAWAQCAKHYPPAANRAQQWLEHMKRTHSVDPGIQPNLISYNTVIRAHARAGNPQQAEALLLELLDRSNQDASEPMRPNRFTVGAVLTAWAHVGTWDAAERAERILTELFPPLGLTPDLHAYSTCLACWAKIPVPLLPLRTGQQRRRKTTSRCVEERAQALFDRLLEQQPEIQPDVVAYTNLMNVYGRHGNTERVEELLQDMLQRGLKPNVHTLSVVVSAWARSKRPNAAEQAEAWLHRMSEEFGVAPNVVSYTTVLQAWSHRAKRDPQAPDRARALLHQMQSLSNRAMKPNGISYTTVIKAHAEQGRAVEAEALLETMLQDPRLPDPDVYAFAAALYAWSKTDPSHHPPREAAQRAEQLLMRLYDLHRQFQSSKENKGPRVSEPPNVHCFSNVILCWSRIPDAEGAEAIFRTMESYGVAPNLYAFNIVLNAWANQASTHPEAVNRSRALLHQVLSNSTVSPDEYTYRAMFKTICTSPFVEDRFEEANALIDEMRERGISPSPYFLQRLTDLETTRADAD